MAQLDRKRWDKGVTLIELVIGMAVLTVVGLMVASILGSSVNMYHSTITYADIQTESQTVSRRISNMIMNAQNIYFDDTDEGTFLFTGTRLKDGEDVRYTGDIIWFNKKTNCLYQKNNLSLMGVKSTMPERNGMLTAAYVKSELEGNGGTDPKEFLISDKIKSLTMTKPQDQNSTINYTLTLTYIDSKDYVVSSGATPRNQIIFFQWNEVGHGR